MADKQIKTRIQQKHDVAANWAKATNFIPKKGEIIIYDAEYDTAGVETTPVRFKIGNGSATVNALPFVKASNEVKLGGSTAISGVTGLSAEAYIDQVYANIGSSDGVFRQILNRVEPDQYFVMGFNATSGVMLMLQHVTCTIENDTTVSNGTPVETGNRGLYHLIVAEKLTGSDESELTIVWAEKAGAAYSYFESAFSGSWRTINTTVAKGWNGSYVNSETGLCDFSSFVGSGSWVWQLNQTALYGSDVGGTPQGNYFFAGSKFSIGYLSQLTQTTILDEALGGDREDGYFLNGINLNPNSLISWRQYQTGVAIGDTITFNTKLKISTVGACLYNIFDDDLRCTNISRKWSDTSGTYTLVPIVSSGANGDGDWTLCAVKTYVNSVTSYGLAKISHPLTTSEPLGSSATFVFNYTAWSGLSSKGAWTTNAGSRTAQYINFGALSLLHKYMMFGDYDVIKLSLKDMLEAQGRYALAVGTELSKEVEGKVSASDLAAVATSGSYNDLSDKPTIPSNVVQYTTQTLTDAQKTQARTNIGAGTSSFSGSYNDLTNKPTIPSAVTSIDGLSGGTLTSPITLTGGDSATASKMILDANGQITDTGTATLFGRSSGNLIVGSSSYPTTLRGKQTRPTYNGNDMALKSDIPDVSGKATLNGGNTFNGQQIFKNTNSGAVAECVMNNTAYDSFTVRNVSDNTKKSAISAGYVWCQDNDNIYSSFKPTGIYYGNDTTGYEGTLKFPTGISGEKTLATTDQIPDVSGKANLNDGNTFYGSQTLTPPLTEQVNNFRVIDCFNGASENNDSIFSVEIDAQETQGDRGAVRIGDGTAYAPVYLRDDTGTDGQVFTSRGSQTPEWTTPAIKSATLTGTTLYLTLG